MPGWLDKLSRYFMMEVCHAEDWTMSQLKKVTIYTDGACLVNPGPGGYGVVLLHDGKRKELSGGFRRTTNNRMEIMAALVGLRALKYPCVVPLYTDSQYLANTIMLGWARRWRENRWMRTPIHKARNHDLWAQLLEACTPHQVTFEWVKGHAGIMENERADVLSVQAAGETDLPPDDGYEAELARAVDQPTLFE
jgi:ribonuclease HI